MPYLMIELILLVLVILLGVVLIGAIVLPIIAIFRTRKIGELRARVQRLEGQLGELLGAQRETAIVGGAQRELPEFAQPVAATVEPALSGKEPMLTGAGDKVGVRVVGRRELAGVVETWVGQRLLGWIAVILLLFATAFFLAYAFANRWVGELGRVVIGIAGGVGLCMAGLRYHRLHWRLFSQMLTAAGIVLLYLATFAAFGYYHLVPREHAAVFLTVLIAEAAALAVLYEAPAIALMALVGALLAPPLLRSAHDQYRSLFMYLGAVNAGVVGIALFRNWRVLGSLALLGSQGLFWGWYAGNYHPEKLAAAIAFQSAVFVLFLAYGAVVHLRAGRKASVEDLVRLALNGFLFFFAAYTLLEQDHPRWMGSLALAMALVYTGFAWLVFERQPADRRQLLATVAVALGFVAMVFPLQADAAWIAVGWGAEGLALWWFGLRVRAGALRAMGAAMLLLAAGRLVFFDTLEPDGPHNWPLLNQYGVPAAVVTACVLGAAGAARRFRGELNRFDRVAAATAGLAGIGLGWMVLSTETLDFCRQDFDSRAAQMALSVVWAIYAGIILAAGFWLRARATRLTALGLFAITLGKVFVADMAGLPGYYRVAVFLVLALVMAAAARAYQKRLFSQSSGAGEIVKSRTSD